MATEIIDARVWTKADTYTNWMANPLALGKGEIALVVDGIGDPVSMRWGNGVDRFSDLVDYMPEQDFYIKQAVDASLGSIGNGQVIAWDSSTSKFVPYTLPSPAGKQNLQGVTDEGNTTTRDIVTRGTRNINFLEVPNEEPSTGDMLPNRWYMYLDVNAPSGSEPEPSTDFYIKQAKDANLDSISDGQLVSWSVAQNKFVPASFPSLTGYATQAWVNSQGFATQSWVSGGFIPTSHVVNGVTGADINNWNNAYNNGLLSRGSLVDNINAADNSRSTGLWSVETANGTGNSNFPDNSAYGTYWRLKSNSFTTDFFSRNGNDLFFKTFYHAGGGTGDSYPWRRLWTDVDFSYDDVLNWNTAYTHSQTQGNPHNTQFSQLLNRPTTLAGFGITDGVTKGEFDALTISGVNTYSNLDTSLDPYLVTDVYKNTNNAPNGFEVTGESTNTGYLRLSNVIKSNGVWTVSGWVRGTQFTNVSFQIDICDGVYSPRIYTGSNNEWVYFEYTYNVTNYTSSVYNFVDFDGFSHAYFFLKDIKVEKSTKATGYTPAQNEVLSLGITNTATNNRFSHYTNWLSQGAGTGVILNSINSRMELFTQQNSVGLYFRGGTDSAWGSIGRVYSSLDWGVDVNASGGSVAQRDSFGDVTARYFKDTNSNVLSSGLTSVYGGDGSGGLYKYTKKAVNQFLGMPADGDDLNSILNRGTSAFLNRISFGNDDKYSFGIRGGKFDFTVADVAYGVLTIDTLGNIGINTTTPRSDSKLYVNGKITATVIESQYIIPTSPPSSMETGKWYLTIRTT